MSGRYERRSSICIRPRTFKMACFSCITFTCPSIVLYLVKSMPVVRHFRRTLGGGAVVICPLLKSGIWELSVGSSWCLPHGCADCQEQQRTKNRKILHINNFIYFLIYICVIHKNHTFRRRVRRQKKRRQKYKNSRMLGRKSCYYCFKNLVIRKIRVLIFVNSMHEKGCFRRETNRRLLIKAIGNRQQVVVETQNFASLHSVII